SSALSSALCLLFRLPAASTLFPYTTLFRSDLGVAGIVIIEVDGIVIGILGGPSGTAAGGCLGGRFGSRRGFSGRFTRSGLACSVRCTCRGFPGSGLGSRFLDSRRLGCRFGRRFLCLCAFPNLFRCLGSAFACRNSLCFLCSFFCCQGGFTSNLGHSRFRKRKHT